MTLERRGTQTAPWEIEGIRTNAHAETSLLKRWTDLACDIAGRADLGDPFLLALIDEIGEHIDEGGEQCVVDVDVLDKERILASTAGRFSRGHRFLRPRIDVTGEITIRGNLALEWVPAITDDGSGPTSDFLRFEPAEFARQPRNRFVFLRNFVDSIDSGRIPTPVEGALRHAALMMLHELRRRRIRALQRMARVRTTTDLVVKVENGLATSCRLVPAHVRDRDAAETLLHGLVTDARITPLALLEAIDATSDKNGHVDFRKASKTLRASCDELTPGNIRPGFLGLMRAATTHPWLVKEICGDTVLHVAEAIISRTPEKWAVEKFEEDGQPVRDLRGANSP